MSKIIKNSVDTLAKGIDSLKNLKKDKQEYKKYVKRIDTLPQEYKFVFEKMTTYMWSFSGGDGYDMIALQADLLELFEAGAEKGTPVLEITGEDVAQFCDELLRSTKTYTETQHEKLNREIMKKLTK